MLLTLVQGVTETLPTYSIQTNRQKYGILVSFYM